MNTFKVLVFGPPDKPMFVEEIMLDKGIYATSTPSLHSDNTTIETLIEIRAYVYQLDPMIDKWCINIRKCRMEEWELIPKK